MDQAGLDPLNRVAAEFDRWRGQKINRREKIPETLLREAQKLTQHYKATEVRRRLGLSKAQLDKLEGLDQVPSKASDKTPALGGSVSRGTLSPGVDDRYLYAPRDED